MKYICYNLSRKFNLVSIDIGLPLINIKPYSNISSSFSEASHLTKGRVLGMTCAFSQQDQSSVRGCCFVFPFKIGQCHTFIFLNFEYCLVPQLFC
jgi:hypothetical protein